MAWLKGQINRILAGKRVAHRWVQQPGEAIRENPTRRGEKAGEGRMGAWDWLGWRPLGSRGISGFVSDRRLRRSQITGGDRLADGLVRRSGGGMTKNRRVMLPRNSGASSAESPRIMPLTLFRLHYQLAPPAAYRVLTSSLLSDHQRRQWSTVLLVRIRRFDVLCFDLGACCTQYEIRLGRPSF